MESRHRNEIDAYVAAPGQVADCAVLASASPEGPFPPGLDPAESGDGFGFGGDSFFTYYDPWYAPEIHQQTASDDSIVNAGDPASWADAYAIDSYVGSGTAENPERVTIRSVSELE